MRRVLLTLLLLLVAVAAPLRAEPGLPDRPKGAATYSDTPLYDAAKYPYTAYTWDGQEWNSVSYAATYTGMNAMLLAKAWTVKLAIRTAEWAVDPSLTTGLLTQIAKPATAVGDALWSRPEAPLVAGGLVLAGGWALGLYLLGRRQRAWSLIGGAAFTLLLAAAVLPVGERIATTLGGVSDGLATALLRTIDSDQRDPLLARAGDGAWRQLVYEPWLEGELSAGGAERYRGTDGLPGGAFLAMDANGRRNACLFRPADGAGECATWSTDRLAQRLMSAVGTLLLSLLWTGGLLLLGGGILLTRLTLGALLLLAPVWLLVALWRPPLAMRLVQRLAELALGVVVKQLLLTAALALFLLLTQGLNTTLKDLSWPLPALLLALLGVGAVRYRYTWFQPLAAGPVRTLVERTWLRRDRERPARSVVTPVPSSVLAPLPASSAVAVPEPVGPEAQLEAPSLRPVPAPRPQVQRPEVIPASAPIDPRTLPLDPQGAVTGEVAAAVEAPPPVRERPATQRPQGAPVKAPPAQKPR